MAYFRQVLAVSATVCCMGLCMPAADAASQGPVVVGGAGLNSKLIGLLKRVAIHYNRPVIVSSGCRSSHGNRRAGGAKHSLHLSCRAADIKLSGISETSLLRMVRALPGRGGVGTYCWNNVVHLDVGARRDWHEGGCRKRIAKRGKKSRGRIQVASR